MGTFADASTVEIGTAHISTVGRNQHNHYYGTNKTIISTKRKFDRDLTESVSDFPEIKRGNIRKKDSVCYPWRLCSDGKEEYLVTLRRSLLNGDEIFCNVLSNGPRGTFLFVVTICPGLLLFLMFSGELEPVACVEDRLELSGLYYIELLSRSLKCSRSEIWMDPTQKKIIRGPDEPKCLDRQVEERDDIEFEVRSDVDLLKEDEIIGYFRELKDD
ncbi:hypothetical protein L218DRAFT_942980 [Marasmius fiardii PR-910]|nr:hypothetical protein L218DRAFT_942980 [Marasmius fiardii PR-910]